jgi:hypothetical protein
MIHSNCADAPQVSLCKYNQQKLENTPNNSHIPQLVSEACQCPLFPLAQHGVDKGGDTVVGGAFLRREKIIVYEHTCHPYYIKT